METERLAQLIEQILEDRSLISRINDAAIRHRQAHSPAMVEHLPGNVVTIIEHKTFAPEKIRSLYGRAVRRHAGRLDVVRADCATA
jgi:hypothetical protein